MNRPNCEARRECDEMVCHRCGLRWDVNDEDRPDCSANRFDPRSYPDTNPLSPDLEDWEM